MALDYRFSIANNIVDAGYYMHIFRSASFILALILGFTVRGLCVDSRPNTPLNPDGTPVSAQFENKPEKETKPEPSQIYKRLPPPEVMEKREYFKAFRKNLASNPEESARALLKIMDGSRPEFIKVFLDRNSNRMASMLYRLPGKVAQGNMSKEEYSLVLSALGGFGHIPPEIANSDPVRSKSPTSPIYAILDLKKHTDAHDENKIKQQAKKLHDEFPTDSAVQTALAEAYNALNDYHEAEAHATIAILNDRNIRNNDALKARALARHALKNRRGALEDMRRAIEIDPEDESARVLVMLMDANRYSSRSAPAYTSLRSIKSLKENFSRSSYQQDRQQPARTDKPDAGPNADYSGNNAHTAAAATMVNSQDYSKSQSYANNAAAKLSLGDYEGAVKYATLAIERNPGNAQAYIERAASYNFLKQYQDAVRDATEALRKEPGSSMALNIRAWALNQIGQFQEAKIDATLAIEMEPAMADAWFNRGTASEKLGNYKQMLDDFQQAAVLDRTYKPKFQDALAQYGGQAAGFKYRGDAFPKEKQSADYAESEEGSERENPARRFIILLIFTVSGGILIGVGLIHIFSGPRTASFSAKNLNSKAPIVLPEGVLSGKYQITREVGHGGMGIVYEAVDQSLGRTVAIKKMRDEIKAEEKEKNRFLTEARTVAALKHPNIAEIYTAFEEENDLYLVFEYVEGVSLDKKLETEFRVPLEYAKPLFAEICEALDYAHSKNIIHRDLKLSNIMVCNDGQIKVMDFGIARKAMETMARLTEVGGSPAYMPPEQDTGYTRKESDIFSLGICLYEVLTGELPFTGPNFSYQKTHKIYRPASSVVPGLPKEINALLARALDPDPQNRFHTPAEFNTALQAI